MSSLVLLERGGILLVSVVAAKIDEDVLDDGIRANQGAERSWIVLPRRILTVEFGVVNVGYVFVFPTGPGVG